MPESQQPNRKKMRVVPTTVQDNSSSIESRRLRGGDLLSRPFKVKASEINGISNTVVGRITRTALLRLKIRVGYKRVRAIL